MLSNWESYVNDLGILKMIKTHRKILYSHTILKFKLWHKLAFRKSRREARRRREMKNAGIESVIAGALDKYRVHISEMEVRHLVNDGWGMSI